MTIGAGYAYRGPGDVRGIGVMADSRLSWVDERGKVERYAEMAVKAYELGARSAMVGAGLSLVGPYAAELTRSLVETTAARGDVSPLGLWDIARLFAYFARTIRDELRDRAELDKPVVASFALVGFYANGGPGAAELLLSPSKDTIQFWRPAERHLASVIVGESTAIGLVEGAIRVFGEEVPEAPFSDWLPAMANAIWYAIRTSGETFASVGGGITLGICTHAHDRFVWPPVEIEGQRFYRGVRVPELDADVHSRHVVRFGADIEYMAGLDQRIEHARVSGLERLPGIAPESRRCTFETTLDEFIGTHPLRRAPEPSELSRLES